MGGWTLTRSELDTFRNHSSDKSACNALSNNPRIILLSKLRRPVFRLEDIPVYRLFKPSTPSLLPQQRLRLLIIIIILLLITPPRHITQLRLTLITTTRITKGQQRRRLPTSTTSLKATLPTRVRQGTSGPRTVATGSLVLRRTERATPPRLLRRLRLQCNRMGIITIML